MAGSPSTGHPSQQSDTLLPSDLAYSALPWPRLPKASKMPADMYRYGYTSSCTDLCIADPKPACFRPFIGQATLFRLTGSVPNTASALPLSQEFSSLPQGRAVAQKIVVSPPPKFMLGFLHTQAEIGMFKSFTATSMTVPHRNQPNQPRQYKSFRLNAK
jgi:hypothetical protein